MHYIGVVFLFPIVAATPISGITESAQSPQAQAKPKGPMPVAPKRKTRWMERILATAPADVAEGRLSGEVTIIIEVGKWGRPSGCSILKSSGQKKLDQSACQGAVRYGRFHPAIDGDGNFVTSEYTTVVTYSAS